MICDTLEGLRKASFPLITAVTGASGHIGQNLVRGLVCEGRKVRALIHSDPRGLDSLPIEIRQGSILDSDFLSTALSGVEVVYNAAGTISLDGRFSQDLIDVNVLGTRTLAEQCLAHGVKRMIHFSSVVALSALPSDVPVSERNGPPRDCEKPMPYDRSKAAGEVEIQKAVMLGLDAVILSPTAVIGPYDHKRSALGIAIRDLASEQVPALIPGALDLVDVRDVVTAALLAETKGRKGERYLVAGHHVTLQQLALQVASTSGVRAPRFFCPMGLARMVAPFVEGIARIQGKPPRFTRGYLQMLRRNYRTDPDKSKTELGHVPRPLETSIQDTIAWQRGTGWFKDGGTSCGA